MIKTTRVRELQKYLPTPTTSDKEIIGLRLVEARGRSLNAVVRTIILVCSPFLCNDIDLKAVIISILMFCNSRDSSVPLSHNETTIWGYLEQFRQFSYRCLPQDCTSLPSGNKPRSAAKENYNVPDFLWSWDQQPCQTMLSSRIQRQHWLSKYIFVGRSLGLIWQTLWSCVEWNSELWKSFQGGLVHLQVMDQHTGEAPPFFIREVESVSCYKKAISLCSGIDQMGIGMPIIADLLATHQTFPVPPSVKTPRHGKWGQCRRNNRVSWWRIAWKLVIIYVLYFEAAT